MIMCIDPGINGAIAYKTTNTLQCDIETISMPKTESEIVDKIKHILTMQNERVIVYLEKVHSMPRQGVVSMFTFGKNYGLLRGIIQTLGVPLIDVTPQCWQKAIGMIGKEKNDIYQFVKQTYPNVPCNKKQADSLAMLHYAINIKDNHDCKS